MTSGMIERSDENALAKYIVARSRISMSGWRMASLILASGYRTVAGPFIMAFSCSSNCAGQPLNLVFWFGSQSQGAFFLSFYQKRHVLAGRLQSPPFSIPMADFDSIYQGQLLGIARS